MTMIGEFGQRECPSAYQALATLACPRWCELPADHEQDSEAGRVHRAAIFDLDGRAHVSVAEVIFPGDGFVSTSIDVDFHTNASVFRVDEAERIGQALGAAFRRRGEIVASLIDTANPASPR